MKYVLFFLCSILQAGVIVEVSPLKAMMGQSSFRIEKSFVYDLAFAVGGQSIRDTGNVEYQNQLDLEVIQYLPKDYFIEGLFVGGGFTYENRRVSHERARHIELLLYPDSPYGYDRWETNETSLYAQAKAGYRYPISKSLTTSVSVRSYFMQNNAVKTSNEEIYSRDINIEKSTAPRYYTAIALYLGFQI